MVRWSVEVETAGGRIRITGETDTPLNLPGQIDRAMQSACLGLSLGTAGDTKTSS